MQVSNKSSLSQESSPVRVTRRASMTGARADHDEHPPADRERALEPRVRRRAANP